MKPCSRFGPAHPLELSIHAVNALSPGFIDEAAFTPLVDDARSLPLGFDWFACERELGGAASGIELQLSLSRPHCLTFVEGLDTRVPPRLFKALHRWAHRRGSLALRRAPHFVLEFDPSRGTSAPLWERCFGMLGLDAGPHPRGDLSLIRPLVSALRGGEELTAFAALSVAIETELSLPDDASLMHVAYFDRGMGPQVRLHLLLQRDRIAATLRAIGWPGDMSALEETVQTFAHVGQTWVGVQLMVQESLRARAGFELSMPRATATLEWPRAMERLRGLGLATAAEAEAICAWYGRSTLFAPNFPELVLAAPLDLTRRAHVKFIIDERGFVGAKGYLLGRPRFVPS